MICKLVTVTRRRLLIRCGTWMGDAVGLGLTGMPVPVGAMKADRQEFLYQSRPKDGKSCRSCRLYSPRAADKGLCAVVEGEVSSNGWCMAYTALG